MIAIVNPERAADGPCDYEVRVHHAVIARFRHRRRDGLAACLRVAAGAVEIEQRHLFHADRVRWVRSWPELVDDAGVPPSGGI